MSESLKRIAKASIISIAAGLIGWGMAMVGTYYISKGSLDIHEYNHGVRPTIQHCESWLSSHYPYRNDFIKYGVLFSSKFACENYIDEQRIEYPEFFEGGKLKWE